MTTKPSLKITGLHIEGLRALRKVDWPEDGLGWGGEVPDFVIVGGVNGSGKTTLLETIADAVSLIFTGNYRFLRSDPASFKLRLDLAIGSDETGPFQLRFLMGDDEFLTKHKSAECLAIIHPRDGKGTGQPSAKRRQVHSLLKNEEAFSQSNLPGLIYLPSARPFVLPQEQYKMPGGMVTNQVPIFRFEPPQTWKDSFEAVLYTARWADLNAKDEGHPEKATHFQAFADAFQGFFGGAKTLLWTQGKLVVQVTDTGAHHSLDDLSSGEKQVILIAGELLHRWKPGSLILIDEPELHFHSSWQTKLLELLMAMQKERGGQVILATQSNHLFRIADPGTTVLLRGGDLV